MIHCLSFATYLFDHYVIWASAQYYKKFKVHLNIWVGSDCHWLNKRSIFGKRYKTTEVPELIDCLCSPVLNWAHLLQRRRARQGWPFLLHENYSYHRPFLKNFLKNTILSFSSLPWELLFGTFTHSKPFPQQASNFYQPMFKNTTIMSPPASPAIVRDCKQPTGGASFRSLNSLETQDWAWLLLFSFFSLEGEHVFYSPHGQIIYQSMASVQFGPFSFENTICFQR